ncbi:MAG: hypothetical protein ARM1_0811 [Candidatus Micrarchaeota archaeon]|nr:MAG: hypothetical protein ARM1_0811 [Candidatus Micrarchaeota archaeon]
MDRCPLCNLERPGEVILYKDDRVLVVETKNKKGHKERIMVVWREHRRELNEEEKSYALNKLIEVSKRVFSYTKFFEIYNDKLSSIMEHWHVIAADINPDADDFLQVYLQTPRDLYSIDGKLIKHIEV